MGRNLDPDAQALFATLKKGVLVVLPRTSSADRTVRGLRFQYNPDTMTRARTGQWEVARNNATQPARGRTDANRGGQLYANSETISLKLVFDVTEEILRTPTSRDLGILPELAFLETVALGSDQIKRPTDQRQQQNRNTEATPAECLLVLGGRTFPVVLTTLTIIEKRFLPTLVPVRAECDCKFRVLESTEVLNNASVRAAFAQLAAKRLDQRVTAEFIAGGGGSGTGNAQAAATASSGDPQPDEAAIQQVITAALSDRGGLRQ